MGNSCCDQILKKWGRDLKCKSDLTNSTLRYLERAYEKQISVSIFYIEMKHSELVW